MIDTDKQFRNDYLLSLAISLLLLAIVFGNSSCKVFKSQKSNTKDSVSVSDHKEGSVRVDSSGSKSDKTNTKETVYYPQPIYIQGKDGESKIVFVPQSVKETGTEKTEQAQIIKDTTWKEAFNSLALLIANKESQTKTRVGFSTFEIIMMIVGGIILLKILLPFFVPILNKIKI